MAKFKNGILTGIIGALSFANYKGKQVVKKRPGKGSKRKRKSTPAQKGQMNKLLAVNKFLTNIKPLISIGYQESDKLSAYNECMSELLLNAVVLENNAYRVDHSKVKISRGSLVAPEVLSVEVNPGAINFTWSTSIKNPNTRKNDEMVALILDSSGEAEIMDCIGLRIDGNGVIEIPEKISKPYHVWLLFSNPRMFPYESRKKISDSVYIGEFE